MHLSLLVAGLGVEAVAQVVVLLVGELGEVVGPDVVVGHHQAVRRDEAARAAGVEPDAGEPDVVEPLVGRLEAVLFFEQQRGAGC